MPRLPKMSATQQPAETYMHASAVRQTTFFVAAVFGFIFARAVGAAIEVGSPAPAFKLQDQEGKWHSLSDYAGQWLVLYFYPKDMTPGCTTQACDFRDNIFAFKKAGAAVLGISVDDVASHKEFAAEHGLPFPILADSSTQTAKDYGVLRNLFGMKLASRETFIINPQGKVVKHYEHVDPKGHSQLVLKDLRALQQAHG
jgi:thioredoxin-dependent peroxiredoxin